MDEKKATMRNNAPMLRALDDMLAQATEPLAAEVRNSGDTDKVLMADYSLDGLNLKGNVPLEKIVCAVRRFRDGECRPGLDRPRLNILLSGVPGGGKTAFVHYLAKEVGAPLQVMRASDLFSKWIGESEQKLAKAFNDARRKNAILFLDEIDSFLQDRSNARHSWEVSSVNELLQQMESFGGVMIGATNFSDSLDKAVLRRFVFKIELDYLTNEGKRIFFRRYFKSDLSEAEARRLDALDRLAPGDFRTVSEELYFTCDHETNDIRLDALEHEVEAKGRMLAKIGF